LAELQKAKGISNDGTADCQHWSWRTNTRKGLKISASKVYNIMLKSQSDIVNLNRWWNVDDSLIVWQARWTLIWSADIALKGRTFIWQIVAQGLFTNERANKLIPGLGRCRHCSAELESIPHIFFSCPLMQEVWRQTVCFYGAPVNNNLVSNSNNFVEVLDHCLGTKAADTARILILYKTAFMIWKVRNNHVFQGKERLLSVHQVANQAKLHALALIEHSKSAKKKKEIDQRLELHTAAPR
jgi:hypothetical protein